MPSSCVQIKLRVIPRARRTELAGCRGDDLVVRLQAPPVEGAANKALVRFLAEALGLRPADVTIVAGQKSRDKTVELTGITQGEADRILKGARPGTAASSSAKPGASR